VDTTTLAGTTDQGLVRSRPSYSQRDQLISCRPQIGFQREFVARAFAEYFGAHGYTEHAPGSLIPADDASVLFTGSTISTFKPHLLSGSLPVPGYFMRQHCLRTQNASRLADEQARPYWSSYFHSIGAAAPYTQLPRMVDHTWEFFARTLSIPEDDLVIHVSSRDEDLLRACRNARGARLLCDTRDLPYYRHKFGMESITGRNCNLAVRCKATGESRDIGNIIVIDKHETPIAVEIAFGVETIVSRLFGLSSSIAATSMADFLPSHDWTSLNFADALTSSLTILAEGVRPVATNRGRVLRTYLQALSPLRQRARIASSELSLIGAHFFRTRYGRESVLPAQVACYVDRFEALSAEGLPSSHINRACAEIFAPQEA
jgi:hypothetical protein